MALSPTAPWIISSEAWEDATDRAWEHSRLCVPSAFLHLDVSATCCNIAQVACIPASNCSYGMCIAGVGVRSACEGFDPTPMSLEQLKHAACISGHENAGGRLDHGLQCCKVLIQIEGPFDVTQTIDVLSIIHSRLLW